MIGTHGMALLATEDDASLNPHSVTAMSQTEEAPTAKNSNTTPKLGVERLWP